MKTFVIDSSTCLKWIFEDEDYADKATDIQELYINRELNLIAPDLWFYEVINGLKSIWLKKRSLDKDNLQSKLTELIRSQPNLMRITDTPKECLANSLKFDISGYDSAYITLANMYSLTLITADEKLVRKVNNKTLAISLKDFKFKQSN